MDAGARLLVHSVEDVPVDDEFLRMARAAGTIYTPTLTVYDGYRQLYERRFDATGLPMECVDPDTRRKAMLTDSLRPQNLPPTFRARFQKLAGTTSANLRRVHAAGIPIAMGTDAGNPLTLHGAIINREMEAMAEAGMSPMQVLVASTRNGARAMGRDYIGTLGRGWLADLVVLDADPLARRRQPARGAAGGARRRSVDAARSWSTGEGSAEVRKYESTKVRECGVRSAECGVRSAECGVIPRPRSSVSFRRRRLSGVADGTSQGRRLRNLLA